MLTIRIILFLQILIYDESIRDLYDNKGKKYSDFQKVNLKTQL